MIRFEILLPLYYNDGRPVEREKFLQTDDELVHRFGATSTDTVVLRGLTEVGVFDVDRPFAEAKSTYFGVAIDVTKRLQTCPSFASRLDIAYSRP
jgi:hypothetical protein